MAGYDRGTTVGVAPLSRHAFSAGGGGFFSRCEERDAEYSFGQTPVYASQKTAEIVNARKSALLGEKTLEIGVADSGAARCLAVVKIGVRVMCMDVVERGCDPPLVSGGERCRPRSFHLGEDLIKEGNASVSVSPISPTASG